MQDQEQQADAGLDIPMAEWTKEELEAYGAWLDALEEDWLWVKEMGDA